MTRSRKSETNLRQQILQHLETLSILVTSEQIDEILHRSQQISIISLTVTRAVPGSARARRRCERSIERRLRMAKFRDGASLESFDWAFNQETIDQVQMQELATGDFIRRQDNLVFVGESRPGEKPSHSKCGAALLRTGLPRALHHQRGAAGRSDGGIRGQDAAAAGLLLQAIRLVDYR